jgi:hypothetical protein
MPSRPFRPGLLFLRTALLALVGSTALPTARTPLSRDADHRHDDRDRGDVPGWVMITVMTAIVVIALLAVFREQVLTAVQNAFSSVTGSGG